MWYVYILKSRYFPKSYVGCTNNIERRLKEHNDGKSIFTKRYQPWNLIKTEIFNDCKTAKKREKFYKSGIGRKKLKEIFYKLPGRLMAGHIPLKDDI